MVDSVTDVVINYKSENLEQTVGGIKQTSVALDGLVVASSTTEKSIASLENKFSSLERRFGTSAATAAQYEKIQKDVNLAVANNPALKDRGDDILAAASLRYQQTLKGTSVAVNELGEAHNRLSTQGQALAHAIRTGITEISLGVPITQVATQQFSHLTYAATGEGGLAGALKNVGSVFGGMISPMTVTIGLTGVAAVAALALANAYDKVHVSSQRALIGAGEQTGTTVSDLNKFADQNSGSLGTNFTTGLSVKEARGFGEELTKTGEIVISRLHGMSDAVVGFANQTDQSMEKSRTAMVGFAVDPKKGLEELSKTFGSVDAATRLAVDELVRADDKTGAFQVVIDAFSEKLKTAAENMGVFEKGARGIVNSIATSPNDTGLEGKLEAARNKLNTAISSAPDMLNSDEASQNIERASREFEKFQAAVEKVKTATATSEMNKLSAAADGVVNSVVPEINQLDKLKDQLAALERAKDKGAVSKQGAAVDNAAALAISLDIEKTQDLQEATARANVEIAKISLSWGAVSQSTALALQAAQNQLPVLQAVTGAQQMAAQFAADYANAVIAGKTALEAEALAASKLEASQAAATTAVNKQVEALKDANAMLKAQANGTEKSTAAAIAYKNAIASGASETSALALKTQTAESYTIRAAAAALQWQQALFGVGAAAEQANISINAAMDAEEAAYRASHKLTQGTFIPEVMPSGPLSFSADPNLNVHYLNGGPGTRLDVGSGGPLGSPITADSAAARYVGSGDYAGALRAVESMRSTGGGGLGGGGSKVDVGAQISQVDSLTQLLNSQTSDKGTQVSNLQKELAWLNTLPETIARDQKIVELQHSIDQLKNSTDANTAATQATLNPLYSQGHGALAIGYYKAASGLDMMAQGPSSGDTIPFHAMVNGGERITITPPGKTSNDNSRQVINNNNFVFNNASSSNARRSYRQFSQGFGQIAAAGS